MLSKISHQYIYAEKAKILKFEICTPCTFSSTFESNKSFVAGAVRVQCRGRAHQEFAFCPAQATVESPVSDHPKCQA